MKTPPIGWALLCATPLAYFAFASPAKAQGNIVMNPGFETGDFTGWMVNDPSGLTGVGSDAAFAHSGNNYAFLGAEPNIGSLSQNLSTTAGDLYSLSFWLAHDVTGKPSNEFSVYWNGSLIFALTPNVGAFSYTEFSFSDLTATGSSTTLEFRYEDNDDFFRLDDVSAAVPEPGSTIWLVAFGLGGLLMHRRRRLPGPK